MNTHAQFMTDLRAELEAEGYTLVHYSGKRRELHVRPHGCDKVEIYARRRMGEGVNNSFTRTWPPGFEFCGSQ